MPSNSRISLDIFDPGFQSLIACYIYLAQKICIHRGSYSLSKQKWRKKVHQFFSSSFWDRIFHGKKQKLVNFFLSLISIFFPIYYCEKHVFRIFHKYLYKWTLEKKFKRYFISFIKYSFKLSNSSCYQYLSSDKVCNSRELEDNSGNIYSQSILIIRMNLQWLYKGIKKKITIKRSRLSAYFIALMINTFRRLKCINTRTNFWQFLVPFLKFA